MTFPIFIMMVGLPASGKSTKAKELSKEYSANIHSSDEIRKELLGNENSQDNNELVFSALHKRIKDDLKNGINCIYDACNISYKRRMSFLRELAKIDCHKNCYVTATLYVDCLKNNEKRERKVPKEVITNMYHKFNIPYWYEGWNEIKIEKNSELSTENFLQSCANFEQDNSHHKLSLLGHCFLTEDIISSNFPADTNLKLAALLHDIGKVETKTFYNAKGELTNEAHYYNHQYVGGYLGLLTENLDVAIRIMWHMQPYFWEKDNNTKQQNKYKKLWGEDLYNDIMLLHEADKAAH